MKYHFKIHKAEKGFWAECLELDGCQTQGDSKAELHANIQEALDLYLSEPESSKKLFPKPNVKLKGRNIEAIAPSASVAFATVLRELRIRKDLTMNEMKEALGIKNLSVYQRLENPKIANPELKTLAKIKLRFPELKLDDVL